MKLANIDWSKPNPIGFPTVTGPSGQRLSIYLQMYIDGSLRPHFPMPAIPIVIDLEWGIAATVIIKSDRWMTYEIAELI